MQALRFAVPLLLSCFAAQAAPTHRCATTALAQAKKLLVFHVGEDDRIEIEQSVAVLNPVKNIAGKDHFDVLEIWGYVYKGEYRMRFLYAQKIKDDCVLMGQEILEAARL